MAWPAAVRREARRARTPATARESPCTTISTSPSAVADVAVEAYGDARDGRRTDENRHPERGRSGRDASRPPPGPSHASTFSGGRHAPGWPCRLAHAARPPDATRALVGNHARADGMVRRAGDTVEPAFVRTDASEHDLGTVAARRHFAGTLARQVAIAGERARVHRARRIRAAARSRIAARCRCRASWHRPRPSRARGSGAPWYFRPAARRSGSSCPGTGAAPRAAAAPNRSPRAAYRA